MKVVVVVVVIVALLGLNAYAYVSLARATEVIVESDIPYVYDVEFLNEYCEYSYKIEKANGWLPSQNRGT